MKQPGHQRRRNLLLALLLGGAAVAVMLSSMPVWRWLMGTAPP